MTALMFLVLELFLLLLLFLPELLGFDMRNTRLVLTVLIGLLLLLLAGRGKSIS